MEWSYVKLNEHIETLKGFAFKSAWYQVEGVPIVRVSDFTMESISLEKIEYIDLGLAKSYDKYQLKENDVVIQTVGSWQNNPASVVGKVIRVPKALNEALLNQNAVKIIPKETILNSYLFYILKNENFKNYILGCAQGAANQASITLNSIGNYKFNLPALKTQQKIASLLSNYDKLIENNTQRITLLESMAEELYKEWFVRLRFPGYEDVEVVDGVPEGWERVKLGETDIQFIDGDRGKNYPSQNDFFDSEYCLFLNTGNVTKYGFNFTKCQFVTEEKDKILRKGKLQANDVIITTRGTIGNIGLYTKEIKYKNVRINSGMVIVRCNTEMFNPTYLHQYFISESSQNDIKLFTTGAAQPQLPISTLKNIYILVPSKSILTKFTKQLEYQYNLLEILKNKNQTLKQTRDLLLPRLMSGKLNVEDLDII